MCHTCLCLSKRAEKGEMGGEALVITPRPDVTESEEEKKKTQQARKNFTSQLEPNLEAKVCQNGQRRPADFLSEARSHNL